MEAETMKRLFLLTSVLLAFTAFAHEAPKEKGPEKKPNFAEMNKPQPKNMHLGRWHDVAITMGKMKKENPEEFTRLNNLRKSNPAAFIQEIRPYLPKPTPSPSIIKANQIETECRELAAKIKATGNPEEKAELELKLKTKLRESFDALLASSTERIEHIQKQIQELKENEEYIINDRFDFLTQQK